MVEVERLLEAVGAEAPCGPNLEYDPAFLELERAAQGRPEQQMGETVSEAEPPDWKDVSRKAAELLGATKDLRVAMHLTKAMLQTEGYAGFAQGLGVLRGLIETFWDQVHPELDPDDDNDPTMRINILGELSAAEGVLAWARAAPLVSVRGLGSYCYRDVAIANGELQASEGEETADAASIEAAFSAVEIPALQTTADHVHTCIDEVAALEHLINERVGLGNGADLTNLQTLLQQAGKLMDQRLQLRGVGLAEEDAEDATPGNGAVAQAFVAGEIRSRDDVVRALEKVCEYYDRFEPSSPLPLFLRRCQRLVNMNFLDIVKDVAPDGVDQAKALRGLVEEEEE